MLDTAHQGQGKNPCLPHLPIEKKRRSQRKSASENKKLTVAKLGPQRAEVAANQMREESNIAAQDALSITRDKSARLKVLEVEATLNTSPIPKYGNGTTGIGNMREHEPEVKNQQAISYYA